MIAALWSVPTQGMQRCSLAVRMVSLKKAVKRAYELATDRLARTHQIPLTETPYALFVAPEYFIAKPAPGGDHTLGDQRHIEESEKDVVLGGFKSISDEFKNIVLIPGTVAWRKPLIRSGAKTDHAKGPAIGQFKNVSRGEKAREALVTVANRQQPSLDSPLSGAKTLADGSLLPALTTNQKLADLANTGHLFSTGAEYMARNTAYVLLNGNVIMKYNKQGDFHEVLQAGNTVHIPGKLDGRFQVKTSNQDFRPIDLGLEICLDHVFQTTGKEIPHLGKVDVHIIASAQVKERNENVAVKPNGYLVHACSNSAYTGVKQNKSRFILGESLDTDKVVVSEKVDGVDLLLFDMDIDLTRAMG
jgi:predicted amidohydrolase